MSQGLRLYRNLSFPPDDSSELCLCHLIQIYPPQGKYQPQPVRTSLNVFKILAYEDFFLVRIWGEIFCLNLSGCCCLPMVGLPLLPIIGLLSCVSGFGNAKEKFQSNCWLYNFIDSPQRRLYEESNQHCLFYICGGCSQWLPNCIAYRATISAFTVDFGVCKSICLVLVTILPILARRTTYTSASIRSPNLWFSHNHEASRHLITSLPPRVKQFEI